MRAERRSQTEYFDCHHIAIVSRETFLERYRTVLYGCKVSVFLYVKTLAAAAAALFIRIRKGKATL